MSFLYGGGSRPELCTGFQVGSQQEQSETIPSLDQLALLLLMLDLVGFNSGNVPYFHFAAVPVPMHAGPGEALLFHLFMQMIKQDQAVHLAMTVP